MLLPVSLRTRSSVVAVEHLDGETGELRAGSSDGRREAARRPVAVPGSSGAGDEDGDDEATAKAARLNRDRRST